MNVRRLGLLASSTLLLACGGPSSSDGSGSAEGISTNASLETSGNESAESNSGDGDGDPATGDGDGDATTSTNGPKFDLAEIPDAALGDCGEGNGNGDIEWSNIWIANSPQGTVSKVDTMTGVELARYSVGNGSDPSRTSVNLLGDAVVVDRNGGIMKVAAQLEDCVDLNNNNTIETSQGPNDVLAFGTDECVLWQKPLPSSGQRGPRPVAWEGKLDGQDCVFEQPRVWVGHYHQSENKGLFYRLDGATGDTLDMVEHPWSGQSYGPYGGAVNGDGDFFVLGWNTGPVIRVDAEDLSITQWATPGGAFVYGMTVDQNGDVWVAGSNQYHHLDVDSGVWTSGSAGTSMRGVAAHVDGYIWIADPGGVVKVDMQTKQLVQDLMLPGVGSPVGVSIDPQGFVWLVDQSNSKAVKVDPDTHMIVSETPGLVSPYTYSDMTGGGLNLVAGGPQG